MLRWLPIFFLFGMSFGVKAQNEPTDVPEKTIPEYRFNVGYGQSLEGNTQFANLTLHKDLLNFKEEKILIGMGLRGFITDTKNVGFTTAHADIKKNASDVDTMLVKRVQAGSINLFLNAEYKLTKRIYVGGTLDFIGFSGGLDYEGDFKPGPTSQSDNHLAQNTIDIYPTAANAFGLRNAKGTLQAGVFVRLQVHRKVGIGLGLSHVTQEFSTDLGYGSNQAYRFENRSWAYMASLCFNRFDEK